MVVVGGASEDPDRLMTAITKQRLRFSSNRDIKPCRELWESFAAPRFYKIPIRLLDGILVSKLQLTKGLRESRLIWVSHLFSLFVSVGVQKRYFLFIF